MANPCIELEVALRAAKLERDDELSTNRTDYILRVTGLDLITDFLEEDEREQLISLILLLVYGEVVAGTIRRIFALLRRVVRRLTKAAGIPRRLRAKILRLITRFLGRLVGVLALAILLYEIIDGWFEWTERNKATEEAFTRAVRELYRTTECEERDAVFDRCGIGRPQ